MMKTMQMIIAVVLLSAAGACANRSGDETIAVYCSDPRRAQEDICEVHAEVADTRTTLGDRIDNVFGIATDARSRADRAQQTADAVQMTCVTRTLRNQQVGTCDPGYTLTACTQTRYTTRAGGMAILREVNDAQCRYNGRVLEMQVRCCYAGGNPPPFTQGVVDAQPAPRAPQTTSAPRPTS
jgi:hypothetical protein